MDSKNHYHARMFWPGAGVSEDPATGSAVAAFSGVLEKFEPLKNGPNNFVIEQGYEMGRPSLISLTLIIGDGVLKSARIGGHAVEVARGVISV